MHPPINHISHKEFSVRIEDLSIKLLIEEAEVVLNEEKQSFYHILHDHATGEIFFCIEGEIHIQFQNGVINLSAGEAAIIPKGMFHTKQPSSDNSTWYAFTFLCTKLPSESHNEIYKLISPIVDCEKVIIFKNAKNIQKQAALILELLKVPNSNILPAIHMFELLMECANEPYELFDGSRDDSESHENNSDLQRIAKLDYLVYSNYMEDITSEDIAEMLFISVRQLDRIARKRYGKPIHKVIMDRRIAAAENLLVSTNMSADRIGSSVGFNSRSSFYREFVRRHNMTPMKYRKSNR